MRKLMKMLQIQGAVKSSALLALGVILTAAVALGKYGLGSVPGCAYSGGNSRRASSDNEYVVVIMHIL